jgi:hypothetical protein
MSWPTMTISPVWLQLAGVGATERLAEGVDGGQVAVVERVEVDREQQPGGFFVAGGVGLLVGHLLVDAVASGQERHGLELALVHVQDGADVLSFGLGSKERVTETLLSLQYRWARTARLAFSKMETSSSLRRAVEWMGNWTKTVVSGV